ncbi:MAG: DUF126 domain-containing protein [Gemmatimonadota bacterium]|nr:DUF126 domain-containing protein [Gemmatimonadota bacterium]
MELTGTPVCDGSAEGRLLVLRKPLSFWGGVDPMTGEIADPRHPQHRERTTGRILVMERVIGSSSSSAIMLELLRNEVAPAAIVVAEPDAILVLGILVAGELGHATIPLLRVGAEGIGRLTALDGCHATLSDGIVTGAEQDPYGSAYRSRT